jgi:hypothetical protein
MNDLKSLPGFLPQVYGSHQSLARVHPIPWHGIHMFRKQAKRTVVAIAPITYRHNLSAAMRAHKSRIFPSSAHADLLELI